MLSAVSRNKFIQLCMAWVIFFLVSSSPNAICEEQVLRTSLISRLDFTPAILEAIRKELGAKLNEAVTISYQPVESLSTAEPDHDAQALLVENGFPESLIPSDFSRSGVCIHLCWGLMINRSMAHQLPEQISIEDFFAMLSRAQTELTLTHPWLEPLSDSSTAYNYLIIFNASNESSADSTAVATDVLLRALEKGLLNPFSLEADQTLALNVFAAKDSAFTTSWVPLQAFYDEEVAKELPGSPILRPFPGGSTIPYLSLELWQRGQQTGSPCTPPESGQFKLVKLDFANDIIWIERNFSEFYDQLIMGN